MNPLQGTGTLEGLAVVELGTSVAAPMASQILSDFGATVIKVERVGAGDDSRNWTPPDWDGISVAFLSLNRNKKSVALDFKKEKGRALLEQLIAQCDVLIQNLRPGALASAGFSYERLRELNSRLIVCDMTGFGPVGPRSSEPAYDPLLQAYSGIVSMTGEDGGAPVRVPVSLLDVGTAMWAVIGIYEALRRRDDTGRGVHIELSLLQTALSWLATPLMSVVAGNPPPGRLGSGLPGVVPYGAFATSDGFAFISAGNETLWRGLCMAVDAPELMEAHRSNEARVRSREKVNADLARATRKFDTASLVTRLREHGIPCSPVNALDAVANDAQVVATGMLSSLKHTGIDGFTVVNLPLTLDGSYPQVRTPPPEYAAHTRSVLASLGLGAEDITALEVEGVVGGCTDTAAGRGHR